MTPDPHPLWILSCVIPSLGTGSYMRGFLSDLTISVAALGHRQAPFKPFYGNIMNIYTILRKREVFGLPRI